jgi:proteasome accessory factor A
MSEHRARITGSEMEWAVWIRQHPEGEFVPCPPGLPNALLLRSLTDRVLRDRVSGMTTNGSRMYEDLSCFIEYATPEDTSYWSTVTNELAGEQIVIDMLERARQQGRIADYILNKRVLSDDGNTWGYHTSFSCDARKMAITQEHLAPIGMHLATQNIYAGAGAIWHRPGRPAEYALAQKVFNLDCDYSFSSHSTQPLVSTRNESLANPGNLLRLHVTSMDANMSPWATWMRLGTTSIVLSLLEDGYKGDDIMPESGAMYEFAKDVALDTSLQHSIKLDSGKQARALDIQHQLFSHAAKLSNLDDQDQEVMHEWGRALNDLEADPELLQDRADWVIRRRFINHAIEKSDDTLTLNSHQAAVRDRGYDLLKDNVGIGTILRERGPLAKWMPSKESIDHAIDTPPQTTRAKLRAELIKRYYKTGELVSNWYYVGVGTGGDAHRHWLQDPWEPDHESPAA